MSSATTEEAPPHGGDDVKSEARRGPDSSWSIPRAEYDDDAKPRFDARQ